MYKKYDHGKRGVVALSNFPAVSDYRGAEKRLHEIGYRGPEAFVSAQAHYTDDTLEIDGHPVMEAWEDPYMRDLAQAASARGGNTLEVGYGMGISAGYVLGDPEVSSHTVIECHPDVMLKAIQAQRETITENRFHLMGGLWQNISSRLADNSFQGILFDSYPLTAEEMHGNHLPFFGEAQRLLEPGGVFAYYSDEEVGLSPAHLQKLTEAGFRPEDIDYGISEVPTPTDCEYWKAPTFLVPIIRKSERGRANTIGKQYDLPLMRVAVNATYELTETREGDEDSFPEIAQIREEKKHKHLTLALRERDGNKNITGLMQLAPITNDGVATLSIRLDETAPKDVMAHALASMMKYAMQHFGVKYVQAPLSGLNTEVKATLESMGFTVQNDMLTAEKDTLRKQLDTLKLPEAYMPDLAYLKKDLDIKRNRGGKSSTASLVRE